VDLGKRLEAERTARLTTWRLSRRRLRLNGSGAYSYALNLNTAPAYRGLRLKRADLRQQNLRISATVLADTLRTYSERGQAYVDDLKALIRENRPVGRVLGGFGRIAPIGVRLGQTSVPRPSE
jgi:hypothetical protein